MLRYCTRLSCLFVSGGFSRVERGLARRWIHYVSSWRRETCVYYLRVRLSMQVEVGGAESASSTKREAEEPRERLWSIRRGARRREKERKEDKPRTERDKCEITIYTSLRTVIHSRLFIYADHRPSCSARNAHPRIAGSSCLCNGWPIIIFYHARSDERDRAIAVAR